MCVAAVFSRAISLIEHLDELWGIKDAESRRVYMNLVAILTLLVAFGIRAIKTAASIAVPIFIAVIVFISIQSFSELSVAIGIIYLPSLA